MWVSTLLQRAHSKRFQKYFWDSKDIALVCCKMQGVRKLTKGAQWKHLFKFSSVQCSDRRRNTHRWGWYVEKVRYVGGIHRILQNTGRPGLRQVVLGACTLLQTLQLVHECASLKPSIDRVSHKMVFHPVAHKAKRQSEKYELNYCDKNICLTVTLLDACTTRITGSFLPHTDCSGQHERWPSEEHACLKSGTTPFAASCGFNTPLPFNELTFYQRHTTALLEPCMMRNLFYKAKRR